jgi:hypothetical protein
MEIVLFIAFWLWVVSLFSDNNKTVTDPDRAYGEVDSDGDFGN